MMTSSELMSSDVIGVLLLSCELVNEQVWKVCGAGRTLCKILETEIKQRANMNVFENR